MYKRQKKRPHDLVGLTRGPDKCSYILLLSTSKRTEDKTIAVGAWVDSVPTGTSHGAGKCLTTSSLQKHGGLFPVFADSCSVNTFTTGVPKYNRTRKAINRTKSLLGNASRRLHHSLKAKSETNTYSAFLTVWSSSKRLTQALACFHITGQEWHNP